MDDLSLIVEGIMNKVKKLTSRNKQLRDKIYSLEEELMALENALADKVQTIERLEKEITTLQSVSTLGDSDSSMAKQKIDELLREIEKCQVLLNR